MSTSRVTNLKVIHANIRLAMRIESQPNIQFHQFVSYTFTLKTSSSVSPTFARLALDLQGQPQICTHSHHLFKACPESIFIFHLSAKIVIFSFSTYIPDEMSDSVFFISFYIRTDNYKLRRSILFEVTLSQIRTDFFTGGMHMCCKPTSIFQTIFYMRSLFSTCLTVCRHFKPFN